MKKYGGLSRTFPAVVFLFIFLAGAALTPCGARAALQSPKAVVEHRKGSPGPTIDRIVSALETRIDDAKLLEKAKDKLRTLGSKDLGLIASLCERMSEEGGAGADIAFFLVTALIVLS